MSLLGTLYSSWVGPPFALKPALFFEIMFHDHMIASCKFCRFISCTFMLWISHSATSQRCSVGFRSGLVSLCPLHPQLLLADRSGTQFALLLLLPIHLNDFLLATIVQSGYPSYRNLSVSSNQSGHSPLTSHINKTCRGQNHWETFFPILISFIALQSHDWLIRQSHE